MTTISISKTSATGNEIEELRNDHIKFLTDMYALCPYSTKTGIGCGDCDIESTDVCEAYKTIAVFEAEEYAKTVVAILPDEAFTDPYYYRPSKEVRKQLDGVNV